SPVNTVERRFGKIDIPTFDNFPHITEEERQKQRCNVATVNVGIGHDDNFVIAKPIDIKLLANTHAESLDHSDNFFIREHLIESCALSIKNLTTEWQDSLCLTISAFFSRSRRRVTLYDVDLAIFRAFA